MPNKLIVVTGPREGVGKSTLAANIAARYAQQRKQPVLLIDGDALLRGDMNVMAESSGDLSVTEILKELAGKQVTLQLLRGRVRTNRMNIGVLNLASQSRDLAQLTPEQWVLFLSSFVQLYDVVVDMEMTSPLRTMSFDLADVVVWTMLPTSGSVLNTRQHLEGLHHQKFGFHKFLFVVNQSNLPHALTANQILDTVGDFDIGVDVELPVEPDIQRQLNAGKSVFLEAPKSGYALRVAQLTERFSHYARQSVSDAYSGVLSSVNGSGSTAVATLQTQVADAMVTERRRKWDTFKQLLHRNLIEELNLRRIDLDTKGDAMKERQLRTNVESTVNSLISKEREAVFTREERERLVKELVDEALGLGPLEELLRDPTITEIMVNRYNQIYIERRGKITLSDKRFIDNMHVIQVVRRIIAPLGRRIDESVPLVDARLKDGSRVNAIIPPLAVSGPSVTIRRFPERAFSSEDLIQMNAITRPMIDFLKICVSLKKNIIIAGGTGTGKTTILNMLSSFIPNDERIVTVEDTAELRMQQEHVVRLEARPANIEGQGAVTIRDLVKNCLRMRPDRIVIGECRGGEALDMLQAMNTGHDGSLTTLHANSPRDAFTRLETMCLMAGMDLPVWALREQIRSAVQIVVQLSRMSDGTRKITCITEVTGRNEETIESQDLFRFVQDSVDENGKVHGHHEACGVMPTFHAELKAKGVSLNLEIFKR